MRLRHVYTRPLNTNTVVVLQVVFHYENIYEIDPPMFEKRVKKSQPCAAPTLFPQAGVGA